MANGDAFDDLDSLSGGATLVLGNELYLGASFTYDGYYPIKPAESDFVGASAKASELAKQKPGWYLRGHP